MVVIRKIAVIAPDVIYEKGERQTNFDALQAQIAKAVGLSASAGPGKKLIVQELVVRNARAQASAAFMGPKTVSVALPDLLLRDLGKAEGGLTPAQLGQRIAGAMEKRLTAAVSFDKLLQSVGGALNRLARVFSKSRLCQGVSSKSAAPVEMRSSYLIDSNQTTGDVFRPAR